MVMLLPAVSFMSVRQFQFNSIQPLTTLKEKTACRLLYALFSSSCWYLSKIYKVAHRESGPQ